MGVFCKKSGKWGVFFGKKVENGFFVKNGPFLNAVVQYQHLLFYILLIWGGGCVRTQRAPAYGPRLTFRRRTRDDARVTREQRHRRHGISTASHEHSRRREELAETRR